MNQELANQSPEELYMKIYNEAKSSLVSFVRLFLSNNDEGKYLTPSKFHYKISDILLDSKHNFAIETFRGFAKTTIVGMAFPLYSLMFPANGRKYICIVRKTQDDADGSLRNIKELYKLNGIMSAELDVVKRDIANIFHIRTKSGQEVLIKSFGKESSIRGQNEIIEGVPTRPQVVLMDDIQDDADIESETTMRRDYNRFRTDIENLDKDIRIFIIGNNLGDKCLIEQIIRNAPIFKFETLKIPVLNDNGESNWEARWSVEDIETKKLSYQATGDLSKFYREYMCMSMADEDRKFTNDMFKYFEEDDIKDKHMQYYTTVDMAISEKQSADNTVVITLGKSRDSANWYIVEYTVGHFTPQQTIDIIFQHYAKYRSTIGVETVAFQKVMMYYINEEMRRRGIYPVVKELKADRSKETRILALQPMYKMGVIYHRQHYKDLEEELLTFPRGRRDDIIDALAYMTQMVENTIYSGDYNREMNNYLDNLQL